MNSDNAKERNRVNTVIRYCNINKNIRNIESKRPNKSRVVRQHLKGPNNEKTCEKRKTNKRKVKVTSERKSKLLFRIHNEDNKRKGRDQPVEKMTRKRPKNLDGVDVHTPASKRRSKVRKKKL